MLPGIAIDGRDDHARYDTIGIGSREVLWKVSDRYALSGAGKSNVAQPYPLQKVAHVRATKMSQPCERIALLSR